MEALQLVRRGPAARKQKGCAPLESAGVCSCCYPPCAESVIVPYSSQGIAIVESTHCCWRYRLPPLPPSRPRTPPQITSLAARPFSGSVDRSAPSRFDRPRLPLAFTAQQYRSAAYSAPAIKSEVRLPSDRRLAPSLSITRGWNRRYGLAKSLLFVLC